jgi:hypothetical protein
VILQFLVTFRRRFLVVSYISRPRRNTNINSGRQLPPGRWWSPPDCPEPVNHGAQIFFGDRPRSLA